MAWSVGKQLPCRHWKPWAKASVLSSPTKRDLPMPASPQRRSNWPCPLLVCFSRWRPCATWGSRPISTGQMIGLSTGTVISSPLSRALIPLEEHRINGTHGLSQETNGFETAHPERNNIDLISACCIYTLYLSQRSQCFHSLSGH